MSEAAGRQRWGLVRDVMRALRAATMAGAWLLAALCAAESEAAAQVPAAALQELFELAPGLRTGLRPPMLGDHAARVPLSGAAGRPWPPVAVAVRHSVLRLPHAVLRNPEDFEPDWVWRPSLRPMMDRALVTMRVDAVRSPATGSGQGVVIGIVDTGVELQHPDFRNADGTTRVAWWVDFTQSPAGRHPALENALGCQPEVGLRCRVYDAEDLNELLAEESTDLPRDALGHGTHVASLAAASGLADPGSGIAGVAPEATLVVARVTGALGSIADSDVVLATEFAFERAADLGMPAVVNLSLGTDFGAHDGTSEIERVLSDMVGPSHPGRAIVVAGGNSGGLEGGLSAAFEEPFGLHAEVQAQPGSLTRVPLLTPLPAHGGDTTRASIFVWANLYAEGVRVGFELPGRLRIDPLQVGSEITRADGELVVALVHGVETAPDGELLTEALGSDLPRPGSAVWVVTGAFPAGSVFELLVEGEGSVELWSQSEGDLGPSAGSVGALFAAATAEQTVTVPAASPGLVAVGASINRTAWTDAEGGLVDVSSLPVFPPLVVGGEAFFSSAGPNALGHVKPDVLAPGGFVAGALASAADPRTSFGSVFAGGGFCSGSGCQVLSDSHAVTVGTSMAAPMVSGAMALLLEREPSLTQPELVGLLQSGSAPLASAAQLPSREGGGVIDLERSIEALGAELRAETDQPDAGRSRLRWARPRAFSDSDRAITVLAQLRDAAGAVFDAEVSRLALRLERGIQREPLTRRAAGLYEARISAMPDAVEAVSLELLVDGEPLLTDLLPVDAVVEPPVDVGPTGGGCGVLPPSSGGGDPPLRVGGGLLCLAAWMRRRRSRS